MKPVLALFALVAIHCATAIDFNLDRFDFERFMQEGGIETTILKTDRFPQLRNKLITRLGSALTQYVKENNIETVVSEYAYFNWFPKKMVSAIPDGKYVSYKGQCFNNIEGKVNTILDGSTYELVVIASDKNEQECEEMILFMTTSGLQMKTFATPGTTSITWTMPSDVVSSEIWDIDTNGIRFFQFPVDNIATLLGNLLETFLLFTPEFTRHVTETAGERNAEFIENYAQFPMVKRNASENVIPDESDIQSGDFLGVIRLDGLDPMLGWAMGSTTGHTTMALWIDGVLYVTESTVVDSYWPTDGVQKTEYKTWVKQAQLAGYNVVHVPLSAEYASKFNETAAYEFFASVEGLEYGYLNLLYGWIDTVSDNYPCLPPDYSSNCLFWDFIETGFGNIDRQFPQIADLLWIQAWNFRLNSTGLRTSDLYYLANTLGMTSSEIPVVPEQDTWLYNTLKNGEPAVGRSMVCCVYVCSAWKAAGIFDEIDSVINCGEFTNVDDYSLAIFDDYTQMLGKYTLNLNKFQTGTMYENMNEGCPSLAPEYYKPSDC